MMPNEQSKRHHSRRIYRNFIGMGFSLRMGSMKNIATALVKAQRAFGPALKSSTNPHFRSKYADLSACVEAVIDGLNGAGIALVQRTSMDDTGVTVETVFVHESGEMMECGKLHVPAAKQDPQGYGSALTYARRYSLMAACGIAPEDDDGNAATKKQTASEPNAKKIIEELLIAMASCATRDDLKSAYTTAYALCDGNQEYQSKIIAVKNKRLKELTNV